LGLSKISVVRKLKVAFFSTGDELRGIDERLNDGEIYDSNRYTLHAMLSRLNTDIVDMGVVKDDKNLLAKAFGKANSKVDVLITSGGVSVGEADYIKDILQEHGNVNFWKVAIKPGRPLTFGNLGKTLFFGLPGNPVSVMVTFYQFVQPALKKLSGDNANLPLMMKVPCMSTLKKKPGRIEFQRGIIEKDNNNNITVKKTGSQGSGILRSMSDANCFIVLPLNSNDIKPGDLVDVQIFDGII
jgi:molybdopterin molybdotransferase